MSLHVSGSIIELENVAGICSLEVSPTHSHWWQQEAVALHVAFKWVLILRGGWEGGRHRKCFSCHFLSVFGVQMSLPRWKGEWAVGFGSRDWLGLTTKLLPNEGRGEPGLCQTWSWSRPLHEAIPVTPAGLVLLRAVGQFSLCFQKARKQVREAHSSYSL